MGTRTRRQFIRDAGLAGVCLAAFPGLARGALAAGGQPTVVRVQGTASGPGTLTRAAVEALGGMRAFVKPGQKVLVKPNIGWDRPRNWPPTPTRRWSARRSGCASMRAPPG